MDDLAIGRYRHSGVTYTNSSWHIRSGRTSQVIFEETGPASKGHTLAALGDVNGDGREDLAVGNPGSDLVTIRSGASPGTVLHSIQVSNPGTFGHALADAGDTDGDGASDLLVGDPDHFLPIGIGITGRTTLISGATGAVIRHHVDAGDGHQAGWSVAGLGDVDGDGLSDYVAGIPRYHQGAVSVLESGAARIYSGGSGALLFTTLNGSFQSGHLGYSVCGPGVLNGDGYADVAVGEPDWTGSEAQQGRVLVFMGGPIVHNVILTREWPPATAWGTRLRRLATWIATGLRISQCRVSLPPAGSETSTRSPGRRVETCTCIQTSTTPATTAAGRSFPGGGTPVRTTGTSCSPAHLR